MNQDVDGDGVEAHDDEDAEEEIHEFCDEGKVQVEFCDDWELQAEAGIDTDWLTLGFIFWLKLEIIDFCVSNFSIAVVISSSEKLQKWGKLWFNR